LGFGFFAGPGGFVGAGWRGVGFFLEVAEFLMQAQGGVLEVALVALEEEERVGGGVFVEGSREGCAGGFVGAAAGFEGEQFALGVAQAGEFPESVGELVGEDAGGEGGGVVAFLDFVAVGVVGGFAFVGEAGGLGAEAVFEGVEGGDFLAGGGAWAGGFSGVAAVGGEFALGERLLAIGFDAGAVSARTGCNGFVG
jgi:hypothetical protein